MKILAVGAHADDVELFCGATLSRFRKDSRVEIFSLHGGQKSESSESEVAESMSCLGIDVYGMFPLNAVDGSFQKHREAIAEILRMRWKDFHPDVVITHQSTDTNQDHRALYEEVLRVFKRKCSILGGQFTPNDFPPADRRFFIEVFDVDVTVKFVALDCYKSQQSPGRPYFDFGVMFSELVVNGYKCGVQYAEAFEIIQWIVR
jgi:LmbE family N-acetylglucosaminyl deacetylase